ncbi:MAG TPA: hypothetical protein PKD98_23340 [Anaerolineae bacterium]|nr:hypothetical protein [Anaerolineae bacterium]
MTFEIPELEAAAGIVMTYGYLVEVVELEQLRVLGRERARAIFARHSSRG